MRKIFFTEKMFQQTFFMFSTRKKNNAKSFLEKLFKCVARTPIFFQFWKEYFSGE